MSRIDKERAVLLQRFAPGTPLGEAVARVRAAGTGALVLIGDPDALSDVCDGGFPMDVQFTPQRLAELSKMDGAVVLDAGARTIRGANVHLVPRQSGPTDETGVRQRTAHRISVQTDATVLIVSRRSGLASVWLEGERLLLP